MNSIILTGASRGLGAELHALLVRDKSSDQCIFISRRRPGDANERFQYLEVDFATLHKQAIPLVLSQDAKVVVLISNAGSVEPIGKATQMPAADIELALRVNCLGPLFLAQQLAFETSKTGARLFILNVTSGAARRPVKGWLAYCVSKAAANMALDVLAAENAHVGVQHFDPGVMDTDMQRHIRQQPADAMPDVDAFRRFSTEGTLKNPRAVAEEIMSIVRKALQ